MNKDVARMNRMVQAGIASTGIFALAACGGYANPPQISSSASQSQSFQAAVASGTIKAACGAPILSVGQARCLAYYVPPLGSTLASNERAGASKMRSTLSAPTPSPGTMTPQQLQAAYGLTAAASGGSGITVAVIESGDNPSAEQDLAVFRSDYNLSPCTTANGCFRKVAQDGSTSYPAQDLGWGVESDIDTQTVAGICPNCKILVVEANEVSGVPRFSNLAAAVNTAVSLGASAVSNSYTTGESASLLQYASAYSHPGVTITAASGDGSTLAPQMPADFSTVIAVGGTKLSQAGNGRGWSETVWGATGGAGCSTIITKPVWQTDTGCPMRTIADISFWTDSWDALPQNTFLVYVGLPPGGGSPYWAQVVGTSFGAPAIAAMYALANVSAQNASGFYASANGLTDVTSGSTAQLDAATGLCTPPVTSSGAIGIADTFRKTDSAPSEFPAYYCNGEIGYDAPTGNGSPYGLSSFVAVGATPVPVPAPSGCPSTAGNPHPHPTENPSGVSSCGSS